MNQRKLTLTIIGLAITVLILQGFVDTASCGRRYNPAPNTIPPQVPPWFPHGFHHEWTTQDVIKAFTKSGLGVEKTSLESETGHCKLPAAVKELRKFSIPSLEEPLAGYILSFELKDNLRKNKEYYLDLNNKGELYTWSFEYGNILLVIPGRVDEEIARQYEGALKSMNTK
jgi:hypothetical protein